MSKELLFHGAHTAAPQTAARDLGAPVVAKTECSPAPRQWPTMLKGCSGRCRILRTAAQMWREGMLELDRNNPSKAEAMQRQALELVRGFGGFDVLQARIHNNIGVILSCAGRQNEANREFGTALDLLRGRVAPETGLHTIIAKNYRATLASPPPEAASQAMPVAM